MLWLTERPQYEYHYNNGVVLAYWQYYQSTGNRTFLEELAWPIIGNVSEFFASQVSFVNGSYTLLNVTVR
jgi:trehalose/maltose hydrolase-like predicted phosphorylase